MIGLICCYGLIFQTLRNKIVASHNFFHELGRIHRHLAEDTAIYDRPISRYLSSKHRVNSSDWLISRKTASLLDVTFRHIAVARDCDLKALTPALGPTVYLN